MPLIEIFKGRMINSDKIIFIYAEARGEYY